MNQLELKAKIAALLPEWQVTVDEANMVNVKADGYTAPFVYIEEFDSGTTEQTAVGMRRTRKEEIYFCKLCDMHNDGEARVTIRETLLRPAMDKVIKMLNTEYGVLKFQDDPLPRGFDANEVLLHLVFEYTEGIC